MGGYGSIPMQVNAPHNENFAQAFQAGEHNGLTAQAMLQNQQLTAEQIQAQDMANRQAQIAMQSQAAMQRAYVEAQGDPDKTLQLGAKYGAAPGMLNDFAMKRAQLVAEKAKGTGEQLSNTEKSHNILGGQAQAYMGLPDEEKNDPAHWAGYLAQVQKFDPEEANFAQAHPVYPGDDAFKLHIASLRTGEQIAKEANELRQNNIRQQEADTQATRADTEKTKSEAEMQGMNADLERKQLANAAQSLRIALPQGEAAYNGVVARQPESIRGILPAYSEDLDPNDLDKMGMTSEQRATYENTKALRENTLKYQNARIGIMGQQANTAAARLELAKQQAAAGGTGGQRGVQGRFDQREADKIDAQEQALHEKRYELGETLSNKTFVDKSGQVQALPDIPDATKPYQARYDGATAQLQSLQVRKAKLYGVQPPDPATTKATKEGETTKGPDGSIWHKQDGVLYLDHKATADAAAAPAPPAAPTVAPKPAGQPSAVSPQLSAKPAPVAAPAAPAGGAKSTGEVRIDLGNGKVAHFKDRGQAQAWLNSQGRTLITK